jgi:cell division transport system permease protein
MHRILHTFRRASDALLRAPYVTAVAVGTLYIALLLTGAFAATLGAGGRLVSGWAGEVPISVYLDSRADLEVARAAALAIAPDAQVEAVPAAEAMRRLRISLGAEGRVLDGLGDDALPPSVELRIGDLSQERARSLATQLRSVPGAVDVDDGAVWVARLEALVDRARKLGLLLLGLVAAATAILVSNTLKLAVYARRDEIEIMKLVGATDLYVSAPILVEGILQGLLGGGLAVATLVAANVSLLPRVREVLPLAARLAPADVLPGSLLAAILAGGALLGLVASAISLRRFLRRPGQ